jgi:hypothetical protein
MPDSHSESGGRQLIIKKPSLIVDSKHSSNSLKNITMNALCSSDELDMIPTNFNHESRELKIKNSFD